MNPLSLTMGAYGPFADEQSVDFRALADHQIFLIWGPTGSGKTSMFDAMTYALYGKLPGNRSAVTELRSDHAQASKVTFVSFEFDSPAGQFRVTRKPKQLRPSARGTGFTEDGAKAILERFNGSSYEPIADRPPDVTKRCEDIVGLNAHQFQRVVLLPQGQFQRVLLADTTERKELLRTLFDTAMYQRLEDHLKAQSVVVGERIRADQAVRERLTEQVHNDHQLFFAAASHALGRVVSLDEKDEAVVELERSAAHFRDGERVARAQLVRAESIASDIATLIDRRRQLAQYELEAPARTAEQVALDRAQLAVPLMHAAQQCDAISDAVATLGISAEHMAAELQSTVVAVDVTHFDLETPLDSWLSDLVVALRARQAELNTIAEIRRSMSGIDVRLTNIGNLRVQLGTQRASTEADLSRTRAELVAVQSKVASYSSELSELVLAPQQLEVFTELVALHIELQSVSDGSTALGRAVEVNSQMVAEFEAQLALLEAQLDAELNVANERQTALARIADITRLSEIRDRFETLTEDLVRYTTELETARNRSTEVLRAYMTVSAPRLAAELVDGQPCSVCGSLDHPNPAQASGAITADLAHVDAANASAAHAQELVTQCITSLGELDKQHTDVALIDRIEFDRALSEAHAALAKITESELATVACRTKIMATESSLAAAKLDAQRLHGQVVVANNETIRLRALLGNWAMATPAAVRAHFGDLNAAEHRRQAIETQFTTQSALVVQTEQYIARLEGVTTAQLLDQRQLDAQLSAASDERRRLETDLGSANHEVDVDAELVALASSIQTAARLHDTQLRLDEKVSQSSEAIARFEVDLTASPFVSRVDLEASVIEQSQLASRTGAAEIWTQAHNRCRIEVEVLAAKGLPGDLPDTAHLVSEVERITALVDVANQHQRAVLGAIESMSVAQTNLAAHEAAATEALEQARHISAVAEICIGKNDAKASIESWVLSAYLADVVVHANHHLFTMSYGRYQLVLTSDVADRRRQSGLDLVVLDEHTGAQRPVNTLSGGETFQASLALALGLADIVAGVGGKHIDALFIDEGFGSLDADALQQTIDVLTHLGGHGAMVGVITHVPAMRDQIPVGIEIRPGRNRRGSHIVQLNNSVPQHVE